MSARQIGPFGMTAFVPNGDNRQDTAVYLLAAAKDHGMDETRVVAATQGGFYISDALADALGEEPEVTTEDADPTAPAAEPVTEPDKSEVEKAKDQLEAEKAKDQLEAENPPVPDAQEAVDEAIAPGVETETTEAPPQAQNQARRKTTSGNRAAKQNSEE
jgi:hypothetical protein